MMAILEQASQSSTAQAVSRSGWVRGNWGLILAAAVLLAILLSPTPAGLSIAGHRMLAVFGFAVIAWVTEALDYAVSAVVIAALMALLLGISPNVAKPERVDRIGLRASTTAVSGFRQYGAGAGCCGPVPRRRHDDTGSRQAHRPRHPRPRRSQARTRR